MRGRRLIAAIRSSDESMDAALLREAVPMDSGALAPSRPPGLDRAARYCRRFRLSKPNRQNRRTRGRFEVACGGLTRTDRPKQKQRAPAKWWLGPPIHGRTIWHLPCSLSAGIRSCRQLLELPKALIAPLPPADSYYRIIIARSTSAPPSRQPRLTGQLDAEQRWNVTIAYQLTDPPRSEALAIEKSG